MGFQNSGGKSSVWGLLICQRETPEDWESIGDSPFWDRMKFARLGLSVEVSGEVGFANPPRPPQKANGSVRSCGRGLRAPLPLIAVERAMSQVRGSAAVIDL